MGPVSPASSLEPKTTTRDQKPPNFAIADTGATGHYILESTPHTNKVPANPPITVTLPDGSTTHSTHMCTIPLPALPPAATIAHIMPGLANHALVSIGQLCDHGCNALFTPADVQIYRNQRLILHGPRDHNGLWRLAIHQPTAQPPTNAPTGHANVIVRTTTMAELMAYLHACLFSPAISTLLDAVNNNQLTTFPGLTNSHIQRHLQKPMATSMGHLDQERQGLRSTKPKPAKDTDDEPMETLTTPTHTIFAAIEDIPIRTGQIHTDQTGQFPAISSEGNRYVMVLYDYDSNAILAEPLKSRTGAEILRGFKHLQQILVKHGLRPKLHRLDNEASTILKEFLVDEAIEYQLVPPGQHRRNAAERAIRTWKNHFIAGLCSVNPHYPLQLWDKLIPQANITLNLLRRSRINPALSAHAQIFGAFDFNKTPLAPPGTSVLVHEKADSRKSWAPHGKPGFYLGPAMEHYRCYRVYILETNAERVADTVEFFPHKIPMPALSATDAAQHAVRDLIEAINQPHPATPFPHLGDEQLVAIREIADILTAPVPRVRTAETQPTAHTNIPTYGAPQPAPQLQPQFAAKVSLPTQAQPDTNLDVMFDTPQLLPRFTPQAHAVFDPATGKEMEYRDLLKNANLRHIWQSSASREFGRLAQGLPSQNIQGTDTIRFIRVTDMPPGRTATYARFVCSLRPNKEEVERTRITVGGDRIDYPGDTHAPTGDITLLKLMVNSTLSTEGAKMVILDLKNFYLGTPLPRPEYMKIHISLIPDEIIEHYNLRPLVYKDHVYIEINQGMYGLPQAGLLANNLLAQRLAHHGYYRTRHTPGLWRHVTRPISFALVVDDFAIKYVGKAHADHLIAALTQQYEGVTIDWAAKIFCGITIDWDYKRRTATLSMPQYITKALEKFQHPLPAKPQHAPHRHSAPQYGAKTQMIDPPDTTNLLPAHLKRRIEQIVGTCLYYGRAVDSTILVALSAIASQQAHATEQTQAAAKQLLDYLATHPDAKITYHASDMILKIHSDAGYLNETKARSRAGGHFYLGNQSDKPDFTNGAVLNPTGILKHVASSAAEAEVGALFVNAKEGEILRTTLTEMGHPQPATTIYTDNSTATGIMNNTIHRQRSRAMDMRYHWTQDRVAQQHFHVLWIPAAENLADYFTKHFPGTHHQQMRPQYVGDAQHQLVTASLRGCANPSLNPAQTATSTRQPHSQDARLTSQRHSKNPLHTSATNVIYALI